MFAYEFFIQEISLITKSLQGVKITNCELVLSLKDLVFIGLLWPSLFCFHDLDKHGDYVYFIMSFTNIWVWEVRL